jgi:PIN domain nuclease of toxin-antitoxin system
MVILDTHALLWWLTDPGQLSDKARTAIEAASTTVFVSAASVWEIVLKKSLGKLEVPDDLATVVEENRFVELPITHAHALKLGTLPSIHRDPFDRILVAQAQCEECALVSRDANILRYHVECIVA